MGAKKQVEFKHLDLLSRGIDDFPPGTVTESESPDFLITAPGRIVGVEITRIYTPADPNSPPPQSQEAERRLIAERAGEIATDRLLAPVLVGIYFDSHQSVAKKNRESIASQLVDLVAANMPALGERRSIEKDDSVEKDHSIKLELPSEVRAVSIWGLAPHSFHRWLVSHGGFVHEDFAPYLQQVINDKNGKVAEYLRKCDACWLVVVADWHLPSACFEISDKMSGHNYTTAFDRVYFVENLSGRVVALNTSKTAGE